MLNYFWLSFWGKICTIKPRLIMACIRYINYPDNNKENSIWLVQQFGKHQNLLFGTRNRIWWACSIFFFICAVSLHALHFMTAYPNSVHTQTLLFLIGLWRPCSESLVLLVRLWQSSSLHWILCSDYNILCSLTIR